MIISGDRHWAELSVTNTGTPHAIYDLTSSCLNQIHKRGTPTENRSRAIPKTYHLENYGAVLIDWQKEDPEVRLQVLDHSGKSKIEKRLRLSELQMLLQMLSPAHQACFGTLLELVMFSALT